MRFTVEHTMQGIRVSAMHNGYRVFMYYIGYTLAEARAEFKAYLASLS